MQKELYSVIGQLAIFMICAQAIIHFRAKPAYEKYLKLLFSVMILLQLFGPIGSLMGGKGGDTIDKSVRDFQEKINCSIEEAAKRASLTEKQLQQMSLTEVQERMQELQEQQQLQKKQEVLEQQEGQEQQKQQELQKYPEYQKMQKLQEQERQIAPVEKIEIQITE